ncbi:MAG: hypothetical protein WBP12_02290 [Candidatus Saccharimonas sp.]
MTQGYEDPTREDMLAEVALRDGDIDTWREREPIWIIDKRVYEFLGTTRGSNPTDDILIRGIVILEQLRQEGLITERNRERAAIEREKNYRKHVEAKVNGLAAAIKQFVASGDEGQLIEALYDAFRPEYENLRHELASIKVHFSPIG